ncbi:hypothetical protein AVEN_106975-1 [Araneus ventricosus]|uniref:Uncharacterized protein n=1 Tax=Araneus ventricosus TaxID=182803 RepID=A0A4Y1ZQ17_ARAVE|nr:hypothetical protein AVEN_106975-1 [Araneus ventricosus]
MEEFMKNDPEQVLSPVLVAMEEVSAADWPKKGRSHRRNVNQRAQRHLVPCEEYVRQKKQLPGVAFKLPQQFGFTPQLSTTHQLLRVVERINEGKNSNLATAAIFIDIAKAFDKVWIKGLIHKLIAYKFLDTFLR